MFSFLDSINITPHSLKVTISQGGAQPLILYMGLTNHPIMTL